MCEFIIGQKYSREEIHEQIGGDLISYMPTVDHIVVAVCIRLDMNPHAPEIILVGPGDDIEKRAKIFIQNRCEVPLFLKGYVGMWEYLGEFRAISIESDPKKIRDWAEIAGRKVLWALLLEKTC